MPEAQRQAPDSSMNLDDILFILFRHKWKILLCAAIGFAAAAAVYLFKQRLYESEAKLMVRYVVDRSAVDTLNPEPKVSDMGLINSEVQILTSWDLAMQVAGAVGVDRLLPEAKGQADLAVAANSIRAGLTAVSPKYTNIIVLTYKNRDPELATLVLKELVARYFTKHLEVHRSADAFDFVTRQTDQVKAQLNRTEEKLKELKAKAGITSLSESTTALNAELAKTRDALHTAETGYAGQQALVQELEKSLAEQKKAQLSDKPIDTDSEVVKQYQSLFARLTQLRQTELDHLSKYAHKAYFSQQSEERLAKRLRRQIPGQLPALGENTRVPVGGSGFLGRDRESAKEVARKRYIRQNDTGFAYQRGKKDFDTLVKEAEKEILEERLSETALSSTSEDPFVRVNQMQIQNLEQQLSDLEKRFPGLVATLPAAASQIRELDLSADRARLAETQARIQTLTAHLSDLEKQSEQLSEIGPQITQLERRREIEDANYKYFEASLEKARIDEALDPSKMPNISAVQKPSPAVKANSDLKKTVIALAGGGIAMGIALAMLMELIVDRSIKRPLEITTRLRIPLLLWIPYIRTRGFLALCGPRRQSALALRASRRGEIAPWELGHFIRPFAEALRDRITLWFQVNGMIHKPKLVGVTGCSTGTGTSTLAGGLAAALSEIGDGKVLLVDMNVGRAVMHPFYRGASACTLAEALVGEPAPAGENLYLATATHPDSPQMQVIPKRFYDLVPHLKASDFDYIIFDMPPVSQTSITLAMAAYMDKVLIIAEAEKTNRDAFKRVFAELAAVNANVAAVLNKLRFSTPTWLQVAY
jgi:uncharacterized protein involved in exopolysaccharide biosynthesis/Mrp family chromosome partitioning ATPase